MQVHNGIQAVYYIKTCRTCDKKRHVIGYLKTKITTTKCMRKKMYYFSTRREG